MARSYERRRTLHRYGDQRHFNETNPQYHLGTSTLSYKVEIKVCTKKLLSTEPNSLKPPIMTGLLSMNGNEIRVIKLFIRSWQSVVYRIFMDHRCTQV